MILHNIIYVKALSPSDLLAD